MHILDWNPNSVSKLLFQCDASGGSDAGVITVCCTTLRDLEFYFLSELCDASGEGVELSLWRALFLQTA